MENRTLIFTTESEQLADMIQSKLEAENIDTLKINHRDTVSHAFGVVELYVLNENAEKAKEIIAASND